MEILRNRSLFEIKFDKESKKFLFNIKRYSAQISLDEEPIVENEIKIEENNFEKIGTLIDGLKYSEVLHPVTKDIKLLPFGKDNKYIIHIKWEGWNIKKLSQQFPFLKQLETQNVRELALELESLKKRIDSFLNKINKNELRAETFYRQALNILLMTLSAYIPNDILTTRTLIPNPFRKIQFKKFSDNSYLQITLTPSEARNVARFLEKYFRFLD